MSTGVERREEVFDFVLFLSNLSFTSVHRSMLLSRLS